MVESALEAGGACAAANWSEVHQRILAHARNWELARSLLTSYALAIEPVTQADAEWAARRWVSGEGLSLADRLCLALGHRLAAEVWTADRNWRGDRIHQIR